MADQTEFQRVGISTHGGVIRNLVHSMLPPKIAIPNCCVYEMLRENKAWILKGKL